jgi:hypothetical protein
MRDQVAVVLFRHDRSFLGFSLAFVFVNNSGTGRRGRIARQEPRAKGDSPIFANTRTGTAPIQRVGHQLVEMAISAVRLVRLQEIARGSIQETAHAEYGTTRGPVRWLVSGPSSCRDVEQQKRPSLAVAWYARLALLDIRMCIRIVRRFQQEFLGHWGSLLSPLPKSIHVHWRRANGFGPLLPPRNLPEHP